MKTSKLQQIGSDIGRNENEGTVISYSSPKPRFVSSCVRFKAATSHDLYL